MLIAASAGIGAARADARTDVTGSITGSASGLPVPRFVSLKADKVNMHIGPAKHYEVKWLYQRAGLPVEITAEFENWRRIRDSDGTEGWVYHSLLSGRRTGVVTAKSKEELISLYDKPDAKGSVTAQLQPGVLGSVKRCNAAWCRVTGQGLRRLGPAGAAVGRLSEREGGLSGRPRAGAASASHL